MRGCGWEEEKKSDTTESFLFSDKKKIFIQVTNNKFY